MMSARVFTIGDFIRRVVDALLRGGRRGSFLCSRCLVKLAKDHLDKSYTTRQVTEVMEDLRRGGTHHAGRDRLLPGVRAEGGPVSRGAERVTVS